jgi:hypothetical protein
MKYISDSVYQHSDFSAVTENTNSSRTDLNQPITGSNRRGRIWCGLVSGERIWSETARDEEWICKEKSVREPSEFQ